MDLGELLTVTVLLLVALAATFFEDDDLVALYEGDEHFGLHLSAADGGGADGDLALVVDEEDLVELYAVTLVFLGEVVDEEFSVLLDFELLTSNFNDCVHSVRYVKRLRLQAAGPDGGRHLVGPYRLNRRKVKGKK